MIHVVDTHAIIWFLQGEGLGAKARAVLRAQESALVVPTIALAEIKFLKERGRIQPSLDEVMTVIGGDPRFTIYPFDEGVLARMPTTLEIHDAIIVGTALSYENIFADDVQIITRDAEIESSGLVRTVW